MADDTASAGSESPATTTPESTAPATGSDPKITSETPDPNAAAPTEGADSGEPGAEKPGESDERPKESRAQRRIKDLVSQVKDLQRQVSHYQTQATPARQPRTLDPLDFPNDSAYQAALIRQTVEQTQTGFAKTQAQAAEAQAQVLQQQVWEARTEDYKTKVPDFEQVAYSSSVPYSQVMLHIVRGMESGPAVSYYLGKNPQEAFRLSQMSPVEAAVELGRLEQRMTAPTTRRVSAAPPPPMTLRGGQAPASKAPAEMSMDEYSAWFKSRGGKK